MNKEKLKIIIPLIYLLACLLISFNRIPFWDEARGWLIAQNCNFIEMLDLMKLEGHTLLWFLVIKPFAKWNLFYPYSIYIINALFSFFAMLFMWKKAPFNYFEKSLITFSVPFLFLWGCVARCYSIGILFIFLALSIYKERFKKPYLYLSFLALAMNTSVLALIGSFFLALIFIFENLKNKNFIKLFFIFILACLIVLIQIFSLNPDYLKQAPEMGFMRDFLGFILKPLVYIEQYKLQSILMSALRMTTLLSVFVFVFYCLKNSKKTLFFILSTYFSMIVLFSVFYSGNFWHYFFFYFYFICVMWIVKLENKGNLKILNICFCLILTLFMFKGSLFIDSKLTTINNSKSKFIAQEILTNSIYKNKKLFCLDPWSDIVPASLPYLSSVVIYDINNQDRKTFQSMRNQINFNLGRFDVEKFAEYIDKESILLTNKAFFTHEYNNKINFLKKENGEIVFIGNKTNISFIPLQSLPELKFWSYLIKVNKSL